VCTCGELPPTQNLKKRTSVSLANLVEIWFKQIVNCFSAVAEYMEPTEPELIGQHLVSKDQHW